MGIVTSEETHGNDYMKNPVSETFTLKDGVATWKNQAEDGHESNAARPLLRRTRCRAGEHVPVGAGAAEEWRQAAAAPGGEASIKALKTVPVEAGGKKVNATLYQIEGLSFTPVYFWLDDQHNAFAAVSSWSGLIRQGFESAYGTLLKVQDEIEIGARRKPGEAAYSSSCRRYRHHQRQRLRFA